MKILVADDSSLLRDRIKSLIQNISNESVVYEAENGSDALYIIMQNQPELAILDIRMPEMTGIEVLKKIRELKVKVKICILTNYAYPIYKRKCLEEGADFFLRKTEDFEEIEIIVRDMLREEVINNKSLFI
jgi:DNA-binding NarL/FixJ family response regulator